MKRLLTLLLSVCCVAQAQWSNDPRVNTPVFTGPNSQSEPTGVSDGSGGAFAFWFHQETGATGSTRREWMQAATGSGLNQRKFFNFL